MSIDLVITPLMQTDGPGPAFVRRNPIHDERGFFSRLFSAEQLVPFGWPGGVAHVNHSFTAKAGTVRGFHYQLDPYPEAKLVTCIRGAVLDIAVDARSGSATRFSHVTAELSAENGGAMLIPAGFAHGFQALTDDVELIYLHSSPYVADAQGGFRPDDPALTIAWPLTVALTSAKDAAWPLIAEGVR